MVISMTLSTHWSSEPMPILQAVREATDCDLNSNRQIYKKLYEHGIDFNSVVVFGCGLGYWLEAAISDGVADVRGYDIPEIPVEDRKFPNEQFVAADLSKILPVDRKFDLVVSAEVAEHIPPSGVQNFIQNLCNFGDMVLFTAAPPYQGGMGHCNENWVEYWVCLFRECGFEPYDFLRADIWNDPSIAYYYRQSVMVFAPSTKRQDMLDRGFVVEPNPRTLIHPDLYLKAINRGRSPKESRLKEDVEIYYSHVMALKNDCKLKPFEYRYGKEGLGYKPVHAETRAEPSQSSFSRLARRFRKFFK